MHLVMEEKQGQYGDPVLAAHAEPVPSELPRRLVEEFGAFGPAYMRWLHGRLPAAELSYPRMKLLVSLQHRGPQIMSALGEQLSVTPRNITALVDALEEEGLVRRRAHPTDRRATIVELTPEGKRMCGQSWSEHVAVASPLFANLAEPDQRELLRIIGLLRESLRREGVSGPHPGPGCP